MNLIILVILDSINIQKQQIIIIRMQTHMIFIILIILKLMRIPMINPIKLKMIIPIATLVMIMILMKRNQNEK